MESRLLCEIGNMGTVDPIHYLTTLWYVCVSGGEEEGRKGGGGNGENEGRKEGQEGGR